MVESQAHIEKIENLFENKIFGSLTLDHSSLRNPHNHEINLGLWNYLIPNIDMRKCEGNDPITWIFQMEKFFDLHTVPTLQKINSYILVLKT